MHVVDPPPHSGHVLVLLERCILGQGTGHTTLDGQSCGSALLRCVNPSLRTCSLSQPTHMQLQVLTLTSNIFSWSTLGCGTPICALETYLRSTQSTPPHTPSGHQMCYCICGRASCYARANLPRTVPKFCWSWPVANHKESVPTCTVVSSNTEGCTCLGVYMPVVL